MLRPALATTVAVFVAIGLAYSVIVQKVSCNQTTHYTLVQALADGTPRVDRYRDQTCDLSYLDGHWYAAKGPLLAFVSLPAYLVLDAAGAVPVNEALGTGWPGAMFELDPRAVWQLHHLGIVLPTLLLLLLFMQVVNRLVPGAGLASAAILGLGTLLLPFASDYWAHPLAAVLAFAAFALLFRERQRSGEDGPDGRLVVAAGVAVMLAALAEYAAALVALPLAVYVALEAPRVRRLALFALGGLLGGIPHALYNTWALGAPHRLTYENWVVQPGRSGHDVIVYEEGLFGIELPRLREATDLLFEGRGLITLTPVLAAAAVGLVLLYRRGRRAEALVAGGTFALFLAYVSAFVEPWGGISAGARYVIVALPFLALGLPAALEAARGATLALAAASVATMTMATGAEPMLDSQRTMVWLERWREYLRDGGFPDTVVTLATGRSGWLALAPFLVGVTVASLLAAWPHLRRLGRHDVRPAVVVLAAWAIALVTTPGLLQGDRDHDEVIGVGGLLAVLALATALALVAAVGLGWLRPLALLSGLPLLFVALPPVGDRPEAVLALSLLSLAVLAAVPLLARLLPQARRPALRSRAPSAP